MKCSMEHNKQISLRNEEVNETEVGAEKKNKKTKKTENLKEAYRTGSLIS